MIWNYSQTKNNITGCIGIRTDCSQSPKRAKWYLGTLNYLFIYGASNFSGHSESLNRVHSLQTTMSNGFEAGDPGNKTVLIS